MVDSNTSVGSVKLVLACKYEQPFDTKRVDMIASTRGKMPVALVLLCGPSEGLLLHETPAEVLEQCVELFLSLIHI